MRRLFLLFFTLCCLQSTLWGQAITFDYNKKVIQSSSISLPQTATVMQVLQVLPELLHRSNDNIIENYTLKIEGLNVGGTTDAILSQVLLMDIEKIEITSSAESNYVSNGQGGAINIILRRLPLGTTGNAFASLGYPSNYIPGAQLNYKCKKWTIRTFLTGEVFNQDNITSNYVTTLKPGLALGSNKKVTEEDDKLHQMARAYFFYRGTHDHLKVMFSEMSDKTNTTQVTTQSSTLGFTGYQSSTHNFNINLKTVYNYHFPWKGHFNFEALYQFNIGRDKLTQSSVNDIYSTTDQDNHSISGKVEYQQDFAIGTSLYDLHFFAGSNYNFTHNNTDADAQLAVLIPTRDTYYNNLFLSPYFKFMAHVNKFNIFGSIEYQNYFYKLTTTQSYSNISEQEKYDTKNRNFIGTLALVYNISKDHSLRLLGDRQLKRPDVTQMFPYLVYSASTSKFQQGNADLKPMVMNSVSLEYLFSHDTDRNKWQFSLEGSYIRTTDNLITTTSFNEEIEENITSWSNSGKDNIFNVNAMLSWKHRWFAVTGTGNYFYRHTIGSDENHTYCNFMIMPEAQFGADWNICLTAKHNTKLVQNYVTLPALTTLSLLISKSWKKRLTAYVRGTLCTTHRVDQVTTLTNGGIQTMTYVPVNNAVYAGIRYNF